MSDLNLWLPTTPRPKPDEPISYEDWTRREALYDRVAERMMRTAKPPAPSIGDKQ